MADDQLDRELPAEDYFDFAANWAITEKAAVTLGINNVLDDNPTLSGSVGTTGNGNTYPQTYDALGRSSSCGRRWNSSTTSGFPIPLRTVATRGGLRAAALF